MKRFRYSVFAMLVGCAILMPASVLAEAGAADPFLPTWKLLSAQEKRQFVAGYLFGLKDATKIAEVAVEYGRESPDRALEGLEKLRGIYATSNLHPEAVAFELERFFADPTNRSAPLSRAMSAARAALQ